MWPFSKSKRDEWLVEPEGFAEICAQIASIRAGLPGEELARAVGDMSRPRSELEIVDGVAIIPITGLIMKDVPRIFDFLAFFGVQATSTRRTQALILEALSNRSAERIRLLVDSPGGTVSGTEALGNTILQARSVKQVEAEVEDLAASAAYWFVSQASTIKANRTARLGSIGTYTVVEDSSRLYEANGIHREVIGSGHLKGAGEEGTPVTEAQKADVKARIDELAGMFIDAVARGRGLPRDQVAAIADGRVLLAPAAKAAGLIDTISSDLSPIAPPPAPPASTEPPAASSHELELDSATDPELAEDPMSTQNPTSGAPPAPAASDELAQLRAENAALKAAQEAQFTARRTAAIDRAMSEGRVVPSMRASIEAFATTLNGDAGLEKLEAFLGSLPKLAGNPPVGGVPPAPSGRTQPDGPEASLKQYFPDVTAKQADFAMNVVAITADDYAVMKDGSRTHMDEVAKQFGIKRGDA